MTVIVEAKGDWIGEAGGSGTIEMTRHWPLVDNPKFVFSVLVSYLLAIQVGKAYMRDRKPFQIRGLMVVHNFFLVALSTYIFTNFFRYSVLMEGFYLFRYMCEMPDETKPGHPEIASAMWFYFISKLIDLMDTAYLVMKKRPVSVLHAYHHTSVLFLAWILIRYLPSGASSWGPMLNSFVHIVMYTYYGLAAIGPHMQKYLWWKKYLTKLQLTQFVLLFSYTYYPILFLRGKDGCSYPLRWMCLQVFYTISLFVLFANFYYQTYIKRKHKPAHDATKNGEIINGHSNGNYSNGDLNDNSRRVDAHKVD